MLDFKLLKKVLIAFLSIPALVLFSIYLIQISKDTSIKDFVIVDKNPLTVNPEAIKDIQILSTVFEGQRF